MGVSKNRSQNTLWVLLFFILLNLSLGFQFYGLNRAMREVMTENDRLAKSNRDLAAELYKLRRDESAASWLVRVRDCE